MQKAVGKPSCAEAMGADDNSETEKTRFFMALTFICPAGLLRKEGVGIGTFRAVEGCQRVREPSLSPLLNKI